MELALRTMADESAVSLDYFGLADADDLTPLSDWGDRKVAVAMVAAQVGPVRLIDNITLIR
jgi:pantothenate synthetase